LSQNVTHATQVVTELESRSEGIVGILEVIDALRDDGHQAVEAMETSGSLTNACLDHATDAVEALQNISDQSCRIQDMAHQIASAAEEQAAVTEEVNRNIVPINDAAINIAEGAKTSQHESTNVAKYTNDVSNNINYFKY
jgi:methyl-accepting chemotaxis protein